ncbi:MAG TPA: ProQ/FinO family protein [Rhizobacter sp.]|nr:ProQ/FinO family protein [Rhizobacter sp.]
MSAPFDMNPTETAAPDSAATPTADAVEPPAPQPAAEPVSAAEPAAAPAARPEMSPADCVQQLRQRWPALFSGPPKPLKLRIHVDIQERAPGVFPRQALTFFFRRHTATTAYLLAMSRGKLRFDLDGQPSGEITDENRKVASEELARRNASQESRRALEAQQRRNRAGLLYDYERTTLTRANFCVLKGVAVEELDGLLAIAREEAAQQPPSREHDAPARRPPQREAGEAAREGPHHGQRPPRGPANGRRR